MSTLELDMVAVVEYPRCDLIVDSRANANPIFSAWLGMNEK